MPVIVFFFFFRPYLSSCLQWDHGFFWGVKLDLEGKSCTVCYKLHQVVILKTMQRNKITVERSISPYRDLIPAFCFSPAALSEKACVSCQPWPSSSAWRASYFVRSVQLRTIKAPLHSCSHWVQSSKVNTGEFQQHVTPNSSTHT